MAGQKAIVIGATGLVGAEITKQLLGDPRISEVMVFVRRTAGVKHAKLTEKVVDFKKMTEWKSEIQGDVAFSALGTTRKQAGNIEAQYEIDYTYQAEFARACVQNGVKNFVLISAMGARATAFVPYSKMKGQLEDFIKSLGFESLHILRPGMLSGPRANRRAGEEVFTPLFKAVGRVPGLSALAPVQGSKVASVAIAAAFSPRETRVLLAPEILA